MRAKILNASAGSGKTWQLAYHYVRAVVENPTAYRHILAVTFTNKATEEMKTRILREIHALAAGLPSDYLQLFAHELGLSENEIRLRAKQAQTRILHDYSRFTVLTIDRFFQRILRAFIQELGIELNYNVEIETASVLARSADALVEQIRTDGELERWLAAFVQERIDDGKKWDVRDGVIALGDEIFNDAPTDVSKRQLEEIVGKAAAETRRTQAEYAAKASSALNTTTHKTARTWLERVAAGSNEEPNKTIRKLVELADIADYYDAHVRGWNTATLMRENYRSFALLSDLRAQMLRLCNEQNVMILAQTKQILAEFIGRNDAPFIYEKVGARFDRFLIDEFQDTSAAEWENFLPLLRNAMAQSEEQSVLLVGDIKQSIYRWRGGDWRLLGGRAGEALGEVEIVPLQENFRSAPRVVEFNNEVIERVVQSENAALNELLAEVPSTDLGTEVRAELHDVLKKAYAHHTQTPRKSGGGYVNVTLVPDKEPPLVERIVELLERGFRPSELMILVRSKAEGARVAEQLLEYKRTCADVFDVMTREALILSSSPVLGFVIACLRLAASRRHAIARGVYRRFLGGAFEQPLTAEEEAFFASLALLPPEEAFERIVMRFSLGEQVGQIAWLQALQEQIQHFSTTRVADIPLFLQAWDEGLSEKSLAVERSERAIEILTIHKAKGLEKRVVLIPYCSWDLKPSATHKNIVWAGGFPVQYKAAMGQSDFAEGYYRELVYAHVDNLNLLYVALTRAVEELHVFIPKPSAGRSAGVGDRVWAACTAFLEPKDGVVEYGTAAFATASPEQTDMERLQSFSSSEPVLNLRLRHQRYVAEGSPREKGVLLHRAFEGAVSESDVYTALEAMAQDGVLSTADFEELRKQVLALLSEKPVSEWFSSAWAEVRMEEQIILPQGEGIYRPDRVMISPEGRAVVVDYKFGERERAEHLRQTSGYMRLLEQMGYAPVQGWVWYVARGILVPLHP